MTEVLEKQNLDQQIEKAIPTLGRLRDAIATVVVGQQAMVDKVLVGFLARGHILLEGVPGLAKTLTFKTFSSCIDAEYQRIQFTPDLLPADIVGTRVYNPNDSSFSTQKGPLFANFVLADEINRAPAKVQSALLEAMQERQVTIGEETFDLPRPYMVMATQNPLEQEGTYPLPEAQVDRFLLKIIVDYPTYEEEGLILERMTKLRAPKAEKVCTSQEILDLQKLVPQVYLDDKIKNYILQLIFSTRQPKEYGLGNIAHWIEVGCSPRATLALANCSKAMALLQGRSYVSPDDVKQIALETLRHRIIPSYEAEAGSITSDHLVQQLLDHIEVP